MGYIIGISYLAAFIASLGFAAYEFKSAVALEGWKLLVLLAVPIPWLIEVVVGQTHQFGAKLNDPPWVPDVIGYAAIANPILWSIVMIWLSRAWRCVVPFIVTNLLIMPLATLVAGCDWAGACL